MSQRFQITLEPSAECREPIPALRRLLKVAGRAFKLRCVDCVEVKPSPPDEIDNDQKVSDR